MIFISFNCVNYIDALMKCRSHLAAFDFRPCLACSVSIDIAISRYMLCLKLQRSFLYFRHASFASQPLSSRLLLLRQEGWRHIYVLAMCMYVDFATKLSNYHGTCYLLIFIFSKN